MSQLSPFDVFKAAFDQVTVAPLVAKHFGLGDDLPEAIRDAVAVQTILDELHDEFEALGRQALEQRTGKFASRSSSVTVTRGIRTADLDTVRGVTSGKGKSQATDVQQRLEDKKEELFTALIGAAIDEGVDWQIPATVDVQNGVIQGVCALCRTLGLSLDDLLARDPATLRSEFLEKVYAPGRLGQVELEERKRLQTLLNLITDLERADTDSLGRPLSDIVAKYRDSRISQRSSFREERAVKFSVGGMAEELAAQPDGMDDWPDVPQIRVNGNADFREKAAVHLETLASTEIGRTLLSAVNAVESEILIQPPSLTAVFRRTEDGTLFYGATGGDGGLAYDPDNGITGQSVERAEREHWRRRDPAIAMFHEMIHAHIGQKEGEYWHIERGLLADPTPEDKESEDVIWLSSTGNPTELRIVGIDMKWNGRRFKFSDPAYNPVTENQFRLQLARQQGAFRAYLRPFYDGIDEGIPVVPSAIDLD